MKLMNTFFELLPFIQCTSYLLNTLPHPFDVDHTKIQDYGT